MILGPWDEFLERYRPSVDWQGAGGLLCLDPGLTTGWAYFNEGKLVEAGQAATPEPSDMSAFLMKFIEERDPFDHIVFEEYRVRGNKFKEHVGSEVVTIQLIGAIKVIAPMYGMHTSQQSAAIAKGFSTDAKLKAWGLWQTGERHANDAIRHGTRYLLFEYGRKQREPSQD